MRSQLLRRRDEKVRRAVYRVRDGGGVRLDPMCRAAWSTDPEKASDLVWGRGVPHTPTVAGSIQVTPIYLHAVSEGVKDPRALSIPAGKANRLGDRQRPE